MPPPVCTGTGTIAIDLQGLTGWADHAPTHGLCGICGKYFAVDGFLHLVTHPYAPAVLQTT